MQQVDISEARLALALMYIVTISGKLWVAPASMKGVGKTRLWRRLADAALRSSYPNRNMQGNLRGENAASGRTREV